MADFYTKTCDVCGVQNAFRVKFGGQAKETDLCVDHVDKIVEAVSKTVLETDLNAIGVALFEVVSQCKK